MRIDVTNSTEFTVEAMRKLIASKDDSKHRQLRVSVNGQAYLSNDVGKENLEDVQFRLETWNAGNGYCGKTAAKNDRWVKSVFNTVKKRWESGWKGYVDFNEAA